MLPTKSRALGPGQSIAMITFTFAGGSVLDAILRITARYSSADPLLPHLLLAAVPMLIAAGLWVALRGRKELRGIMVLQLLLAASVSVISFRSALPLSWYLGIGLIIWAMRLSTNLLMWVGTSLLVLTAGAQFGMIAYEGVLFLPFVITPVVFLISAAYFQWHQVKNQQPERDSALTAANELHRSRYGKEIGQ